MMSPRANGLKAPHVIPMMTFHLSNRLLDPNLRDAQPIARYDWTWNAHWLPSHKRGEFHPQPRHPSTPAVNSPSLCQKFQFDDFV